MYCVFTRIIIRNLGLIYFKTEVPILLTIENAYSEEAFFSLCSLCGGESFILLTNLPQNFALTDISSFPVMIN